MSTMKAVTVEGVKSSPTIVLNPSLPKPVPKAAELLIKVHAAGITADELTWWELWEHTTRIPGHDISGTVAAVGPEYSGGLKVGDEVYSMTHAWRGLGQAEFAVAGEDELGRKPKSLTHAQAAALPIPVLTAWEAIFERVEIGKGSKVLVTGASGAVGFFFVQMAAKLAGAEVIALASSTHHDLLRELGASAVVDYNTPNWEDSVSGVDIVLDTVGDPVLHKTWKTVKSNGYILTVGNPPAAWEYGKGRPTELDEHPDVKWLFFVVTPKTSTLEKVAGLIDQGEIKTLPIQTYPLEKATEAWEFAGTRGRKAKVVIEFVAGTD